MANDTSNIGWTFERFIIELANAVGLMEYDSTGKAIVPTTAINLDKLKRAVNNGYRYFTEFNPRWVFLERTVNLRLQPSTDISPLAVNGEAWRYRLPGYVAGNPKGDWLFLEAGTCEPFIQTIPDADVADMNAVDPLGTGTPRYGGCRPIEPDGGRGTQGVGWELIVYPAPDRQYIVQAKFRRAHPDLEKLDDRPVCGPEFDRALLEQMEYEFRKNDTPGLTRPADLLQAAVRLDASKRTKTVQPTRNRAYSAEPTIYNTTDHDS